MTIEEHAASPPGARESLRTNRPRLWLVRATIVVLAITVALLLWRPWKALDDCVHCASGNGHLLMVRFYLARGENVNTRARQGNTPLIDAAWGGHLKVAELLVHRGAEIDLVDDNKRTALIWAAIEGHEDVVAYLISRGAALDRQDMDGNTAIFYAIRNRHASIARLLLNAGADVNLQNKDGETPLQKAAQGGFDGMIALFRKHGAAKTNAFVGPSPFPVAVLPPERLWALATAALLVQYNGDSHELLGSRQASYHTWGQNGLRDWWGITSRQEAIKILDWLARTGHRRGYQAEDRSLRQNQSLANPYLAWDYCRLVWVAGVSYVAGYLTEEEAWQRIMPAARAIQANYSSWREMAEDYLRGRERWKGRRDSQFDHVLQLLTNPDDPTSPWNKNQWDTDLPERTATNTGK